MLPITGSRKLPPAIVQDVLFWRVIGSDPCLLSKILIIYCIIIIDTN